MIRSTHYNIKKIRELKNLTRDFVAAELGMSTSGYGKIERGEIDLTISKITKIAHVLQVGVSDLLFFNPDDFFKKDPYSPTFFIGSNFVERKKQMLYHENENKMLKKKN